MFANKRTLSFATLLVSAAAMGGAACGDSDGDTSTTATTTASTATGGGGGSTASSGGNTSTGGTGGTGTGGTASSAGGAAGTGGAAAGGAPGTGGAATGGAPGTGGSGGGMMAQNEFKNSDFEATMAGANPPFDPPSDWASFLAFFNPGFNPGTYTSFATQKHDTLIYPSQTAKFPGYMNSTALKMWGGSSDAGGGNKNRSLGTVYQEWLGGVVPAGKKLTLTAWAYHSSVDPLQGDTKGYLVIKCFTANFATEQCGNGGGAQSMAVNAQTMADKWIKYTVTVPSLPANTEIVQAGMEIEECPMGACNTVGGAIFWDGAYFSIE